MCKQNIRGALQVSHDACVLRAILHVSIDMQTFGLH